METVRISRRRFLGLAAGIAGAIHCPGLLAGESRVRFIWWGSRERAAITRRAVKAFRAANPGIRVDTEHLAWLDYWQHFVSLVAMRRTPDLIQMDYRYLRLYAENGILLPLDGYLGNLLDIESFGQRNLDSCRVDGRLYGVNLGINSTAAIVDGAGWRAAGVEPPTFGTTWEAFSDKCRAFARGNRRSSYYASPDCSGMYIVFQNWLRQRGKAIYDADGRLDFQATDAVEWFDLWEKMRVFGGCAPADIQVLDKHSIETSLLILGYSAMDFAHSNMFVNYQERLTRSLDLTAFPVTAGGKPGHYYKPSQMLSVAADSQSADSAVKLANFLVMSPEGVRILGVDRGIPASPAMRKLLFPTLDPVSRKTVKYITRLEPFIGPLPPTPPEGAGQFAIILQSVGHEIAFKRMTPQQGAESLIQQASEVLRG